MLEIISFVMGIIMFAIFAYFFTMSWDLMRFSLKLRRVLRSRGYFKLTEEDLDEKFTDWEKALRPILHPGAPPDPNDLKIDRQIERKEG